MTDEMMIEIEISYMKCCQFWNIPVTKDTFKDYLRSIDVDPEEYDMSWLS